MPGAVEEFGWWVRLVCEKKKQKKRKEMGREGSRRRWGMRWGRGESDLKMGHMRPKNECAQSHQGVLDRTRAKACIVCVKWASALEPT